ncbi:MAG TPA: hypothetical protein VMW52_08960 [Phycisphaerae bacterium]|nr:hypothetical protein [Phycisphaerae bacterium]
MSASDTGKRTGTREWSEHSLNCCRGCSHACVYCYARRQALRYGRIPNGAAWADQRALTVEQVQADGRFARRYRGVVMLPTTHDLTLGPTGALRACRAALWRLLEVGNRVLVVTKPSQAAVDAIVSATHDPYLPLDQDGVSGEPPPPGRSRIEVRCTITHLSPAAGRIWEPGAPTAGERIDCLRRLQREEIATSVSVEPLLEPWRAEELVDLVTPYVSAGGEIWVGHCNRLRERIAWALAPDSPLPVEDRAALSEAADALACAQGDRHTWELYEQLRGHPLVRWKDSVAAVLRRRGLIVEAGRVIAGGEAGHG